MLIDPDAFWYSGMATGMLSGMYSAVEDQVDPQRLIQSHGGDFVMDRVVSIDTGRQQVELAGGDSLRYDLLSINVGSRVEASPTTDGCEVETWPVKPIRNLWRLHETLKLRLESGQLPRVLIVGGGATGTEVAANVLGLGERLNRPIDVALMTGGSRILPSIPRRAAAKVYANLTSRGLKVQTGTRIARCVDRSLVTEDGQSITADIAIIATGLMANGMLAPCDLPLAADGGLRVTPQLHSIDDDRVFAGGDCAALEGHDLPKLGVFGVRQAPIIHANLLAKLDGQPLRDFHPQKRYLAILNLGDGTALATWSRFWWLGRSSLLFKHFIDRRFLNRYQR